MGDLSYKQRCTIHALRFSAGWTLQQIAENQNLPVSTVGRVCAGPTTPQKKTRVGRKVKINTPQRQQLVALATLDAEHRRMRLVDIAQELGIEAGEKALRKAFAKEGYHRRSARRKPFLDEVKRDKRLAFALRHSNWGIQEWRHVIWTDECYVWLGGLQGKVYVTRAAQEEWHEDCLVPKFQKEASVMIWGCILGDSGKKALVIWERDDWGTISAQTYVDHILVPTIWPFWYHESRRVGSSLWLMEDGAPSHRARLTQSYRDHYRIPSLNWPPASPDLNPIENIWNLIKTRINQRQPRPTGRGEVKEAIIDEWSRITVEEIVKVVDSMPDRIQAAIRANGGHTRW